jgi:hypothetical protein
LKVDLHVKIEKELRDKLVKEADECGVELSELVRERLAGKQGQEKLAASAGTPTGSRGDTDPGLELGRMPVGSIWQVQTYGDVKDSPKVLVQRTDLTDIAWKKKLAERKDKREQEKHEIDQQLKKAKFDSMTKAPNVPTGDYACHVEGCPITAHFRTYEALDSHYRENHPEYFASKQPGKEVGKSWGR